ncbi:unnamed protein product [Aspergillus oryzae]|uniref:Unnamed protein product n=2 Tax=Aspergillus oryzae TaxID=5062 RepID=A0AAN4Z1R5_ASPOZ|nr:unnamed protein product [Aspergillus oryzae]GMF86271.1 unnamed protein product [Aspergillus oryzae]GMG17322.1 unnamed protein product [Aspergillus oryzae]GMG38919.1 unnamed protein product [Aspergillus oryzae]GMG52743.1 unnamed protein product [Aspergillus oryzae var. brunneus]
MRRMCRFCVWGSLVRASMPGLDLQMFSWKEYADAELTRSLTRLLDEDSQSGGVRISSERCSLLHCNTWQEEGSGGVSLKENHCIFALQWIALCSTSVWKLNNFCSSNRWSSISMGSTGI